MGQGSDLHVNTGLGGSRRYKDATASGGGHYYTKADTPILAGSGIKLEYVHLVTGAVINPMLVPWTHSTGVGLKISVE
jgi:hypothetical protein